MITFYVWFAIFYFSYLLGKRAGKRSLTEWNGEPPAVPRGRVENIYAANSRDEQICQLRDTVLHQQRMLQQAHLVPTSSGLTPDEGRKYMPMQLQLRDANGRQVSLCWNDNGGVRPDVRYRGINTASFTEPETWMRASECAGYDETKHSATFVLPVDGEYMMTVRLHSPYDGRVTQWSNRIRVHVFDTVALRAIDTPAGRVYDRVHASQITAAPLRADAITASQPFIPSVEFKQEMNAYADEAGSPAPYPDAVGNDNCVACKDGTNHNAVVKPYVLGSHSWKEKDDEQ